MFNKLWKYHPKYWEDWFYYFRGEIKTRFNDWWFWYSPPWSDWRKCGCCAGQGDEHHSFGGDVDIIECGCCHGMGVIKKF